MQCRLYKIKYVWRMYSMSVVIATRHEMSNIMPYAKEMFFHGLNFATKVGKKSSLAYILIV